MQCLIVFLVLREKSPHAQCQWSFFCLSSTPLSSPSHRLPSTSPSASTSSSVRSSSVPTLNEEASTKYHHHLQEHLTITMVQEPPQTSKGGSIKISCTADANPPQVHNQLKTHLRSTMNLKTHLRWNNQLYNECLRHILNHKKTQKQLLIVPTSL